MVDMTRNTSNEEENGRDAREKEAEEEVGQMRVSSEIERVESRGVNVDVVLCYKYYSIVMTPCFQFARRFVSL